MQKLITFVRDYTEFSLVLVAAIVSGITELSGQTAAAHWLLGVSAVLACVPIAKGMFGTLREGSYGLDILALTAIIVSVLLHEYWAAIVIVIMLTGGESLEDYAASRAKRELSALLERAPKTAHLLQDLHDNHPHDVAVDTIQPHNILLIKPGEVVPVDAEILDGHSSIDESSITGESLPVDHAPGQNILSGSVNLDGRLIVKALHTAGDSQYQQIVRLVKDASGSKSPFVRLADRYSVPFTAVSFVIAFAAWAVSGDVIRFLDVLVVATPCPLLLGAPIALISGMSRAAKFGIVMKNGAALERLARAKSIAFDKTGTLTIGEPKLVQIKTFGGITEDQALGLAASLEHNSAHILARVIVDAATQHKLQLTRLTAIQEITGEGMRGGWNKQELLVGKLSFLQRQNVHIPNDFESTSIVQTATYLAIDGTLEAMFLFEDVVRPESKQTLQRLHQLGLRHTMMLTGDNQQTAQKIADELGIDLVKANCLPQDKLAAIKNVDTANRPIAMVGDGVNDAPVLAVSDVGIALGARGSTAASESADVVIMLDDLTKVADCVHIAKRTIFIGKQSIFVGIGMSVILMFIFATGSFKPVVGAAVQEIVDVVVIINALRAHGSLRSTLFSKTR